MTKLLRLLTFSSMLLTIFVISACHSNNTEERTASNTIDLGQVIHNQDVCTSDIFSDLIYIPLETNKSCYISTISQYIVTNNYVLILDKTINKVFLFNQNGEFISTISSRGSGPTEYIEIRNISFIEETATICLADIRSKVDFFNTDGEHLKTIPYKPGAYWVEPFQNNLICFYPYPVNKINDDYQISIIDSLGKTIDKKLNRFKNIGYPGNPIANANIYAQPNEILFWEEYSDSIFSLNKKLDLVPKYRLIYPFQLEAHEKIKEIGLNPDSWKVGMHVSDFIDTYNYVFFQSVLKGTFNYLIYNKSDQLTHRVQMVKDRYGLPETIHGGIPFWPTYSRDSTVSMVILANQFINHIESVDNFDSLDEKLFELSHQLDYDSNPIIVIGILK